MDRRLSTLEALAPKNASSSVGGRAMPVATATSADTVRSLRSSRSASWACRAAERALITEVRRSTILAELSRLSGMPRASRSEDWKASMTISGISRLSTYASTPKARSSWSSFTPSESREISLRISYGDSAAARSLARIVSKAASRVRWRTARAETMPTATRIRPFSTCSAQPAWTETPRPCAESVRPFRWRWGGSDVDSRPRYTISFSKVGERVPSGPSRSFSRSPPGKTSWWTFWPKASGSRGASRPPSESSRALLPSVIRSRSKQVSASHAASAEGGVCPANPQSRARVMSPRGVARTAISTDASSSPWSPCGSRSSPGATSSTSTGTGSTASLDFRCRAKRPKSNLSTRLPSEGCAGSRLPVRLNSTTTRVSSRVPESSAAVPPAVPTVIAFLPHHRTDPNRAARRPPLAGGLRDLVPSGSGELRVQGDRDGLEGLADRAVGLGVVRGGGEALLVQARHGALDGEVDARDALARLEGDVGRGDELGGRSARAGQGVRQRHGEAAGVRGGDQLLGAGLAVGVLGARGPRDRLCLDGT